jgi:uncharacterized protein (DUF927 family)
MTEKYSRQGAAIWAAAKAIAGTLGETYWRGRGLGWLPGPDVMRFDPAVMHPKLKQEFPALIALVSGAAEPSFNVTFLAGDGGAKAAIDKKDQRRTLGSSKGGVVQLTPSIEGKPLLIGEGPETVATAIEATGWPGWASLGTAGLGSFTWSGEGEIILLAENDDNGANQRALAKVCPILVEKGFKVRVASPPTGTKDFNDVVRSGGRSALAIVKSAIEAAPEWKPKESQPDEDDGKFSMTETGLYRRKHRKWEWIAQPFEVFSEARDATSASWGKLIRFSNADGVTHEVVASLAVLHGDAGQLISSLADRRMDIKGTMTARRALAEYLVSVQSDKRATIVHGTGWAEIGGKRVFALPGEVIGASPEEGVILAAGVAGPYERRGTLEDWQNSIGVIAGDHLLLRFSTATALTGPLLGIGGFESGIFHLFGTSSEGKTTCLRVGASLWGSGADGAYMRLWRATSNGLEAHLAGANDTFLPLDEIGQADGRDLGQGLYMATAGVGKQRMRRDASLRPSYKWRVPILSSGEVPIESRLNEDLRRSRAQAGQLVRAIDISASRVLGIFDMPHIEFDPEGCARKLKQATATCYGVTGPEFVRRLIERDIAAEDVRNRVAAFAATMLADIKDYHGQAARAAARFGLVALAGELAIELGVVSWAKGRPAEDAATLFTAWLEWRGGAMPYEAQQIVAQVRHFIEANGDARFDDLDPPPVSLTGVELERRPVVNRAGWRKGEGALRLWYVLPEVWRRDAGSIRPRRRVSSPISVPSGRAVTANWHSQYDYRA